MGKSFADISVSAHVDPATGKLIAELLDGSRLPDAVLEELVCNARLTGYVYDTTGAALWRTKSSRTATEGQRQALLDRWGGCFHCAARPDMCQIHHIVPVSQGGVTKIDNMVPVCWDCHNKIHHHGWQVHKRPDERHTLHPPNSISYGPARAPEQPLLFSTTDSDYDERLVDECSERTLLSSPTDNCNQSSEHPDPWQPSDSRPSDHKQQGGHEHSPRRQPPAPGGQRPDCSGNY